MSDVRSAAARNPAWPILSGVCATLTGVGLQRFAYAPLLPAIVQAGWLSGGAAGVLGAANLAGYLCGAAAAPSVGRALGIPWALRLAMVAAVLGFLLCAVPGGLLWLLPWRFVAGVSGGVLMVLAGPAVQLAVPAAIRGLAAGVVFAGVGSGIVLGAVLVPLMLPSGLASAWLALAALSFVLLVVSWTLWPNVPPPPAMAFPHLNGPAGRMVAAYGFAAVAQTAHMVWWPDFIARGLGHGTATGAVFWMLYGVSAGGGAVVFGRLADRFGAAPVLRAAMAVQVLALLLPLVATAMPALVLSTICAGGTAIGMTVLTLARARELAGDHAVGVWRVSTAAFGLAQTVAGFLMAWLYAATHGHRALFVLALASGLLGLFLVRRPER